MKYINGHRIPRWWVVMHRWRMPYFANYIYSWVYGVWAPGMVDLMQSETLHSISNEVAAQWRAAHEVADQQRARSRWSGWVS